MRTEKLENHLEKIHKHQETDISPKLINFTQNIVKNSGFDVDAKAMDAKDVKTLGKSSFDNILCLDVLEHIENDVEILKGLKYVLKNEGRVIISVLL